jgi:hypothetical protein
MRAGDEGICPQGERVLRHRWGKSEMGRPGSIHDERHAGSVRGSRMRGDVGAGTDVRRVAEHDTARAGVRGECSLDGGDGHRTGQPGDGVQFGPDPHWPQPGEYDGEQQRAVQRTGDHDVLPRASEREHGGQIGVRRAGHGQPAPVHAPGRRRPLLGLQEQPAVLLHGVEARIQRHITAHHVAHEVRALLVSRDRERRRGALTDGGVEPQPTVQQRCVNRETKWISGVVRFGRHEAHYRHAPGLRRCRWQRSHQAGILG